MKYPATLFILITAVLASCQTRAESLADLSDIPTNNKQLISPTPTASSSPKKFNIHSKIGIVDVYSDQTSCLRTKNANLTEKTLVSVIISLDEPPQKVLKATVERKSEVSCARRSSEIGDKNPGENFYYSLSFTDKAVEEIGFEVGIAVIEPPTEIKLRDNLASIDLDEDGKPEFFRRCTSFEGMYFTVWTGKPLKGKRIWDSFYYLDYDTEPDCKKKDREGSIPSPKRCLKIKAEIEPETSFLVD